MGRPSQKQKIVLALGFFDGCHLGHREVFRAAGRLAEKTGAIPGVLTFWPHPMTVIAPSSTCPFSKAGKKKQLPWKSRHGFRHLL